jgi:hypothetical protein
MPDPGIGTSLFLVTLATAAAINQARVTHESAQEAKRKAHRTGAALEGIRRAEGRRERRQAVARAQLQGASSGQPVGDAVLGQIGSDIDRQTAYDVWGIQEQTWRARFAAKQQMNEAKQAAIAAGIGGASSALGAVSGAYGGGAPMSSTGSSFVGGGTGSFRLSPGADYRTESLGGGGRRLRSGTDYRPGYF